MGALIRYSASHHSIFLFIYEENHSCSANIGGLLCGSNYINDRKDLLIVNRRREEMYNNWEKSITYESF